ncbi:MAG: peptidoglycan-binding protein [Rhizobiaceae bacterium]
MSNKRSYLDSINAGRKRRPNPSFQDMDRTLARLEGRTEATRDTYREPRAEDFAAPRRAKRPRYRADEDVRHYQDQHDDYEAPRHGARRPTFNALARDMEHARQQEDSLGAVGRIAGELKAMREELRQQLGQGLRREFDSLRTDIERLQTVIPTANPAELGAEFERLSDAVRALSERSDDRSVNMLRLELEKVKGVLDELAREDTLRSQDRRWDDFDRRWTNLETKIDLAPSRAQFEPTFKALNDQLQRIGQAVDSLPESLSLRSLEDKLRGLAGTVDQFSNKYGAQMPEAFSQIEQRLDEITRAIAASASPSPAQPFDPEPFERIEARVSSLARQIDELAEDQTSEQVIDRLNALSHRVEEIAQRIEVPESAVEILAEQISAIAGKLDEEPARNYADVIFQGMEDRFAQISQMLERRQGDAIEQGQQLFRELEQRLGAVSKQLEARETEAGASNAGVIDAMERRFAELVTHLDAGRQASQGGEISGLEQRLDDISRRLDSSAQHVAGIDPDLIRSLESQVSALSAHLDKPGQPLPEFEDITPRLDHIEQSLAQGRESMVEAARQAAHDAVTGLPAGSGDNANLAALSAELKAFEELSRKSDDRNAKTFETIHDTMLKIVDRLGAIEQRGPAAPAPAASKPDFPAERTPSIEGAYEDDADLADYDVDAPAYIRSPAQAAAAAAMHATGKTEPEPEASEGKRSMLGGLTRALTGRKERKAAAETEIASADRKNEPTLDEPLDPSVANEPLEPGSGAPDLNAIMKRVRDENGGTGPASSMDAAKSDFIAAARRAAQAAAAEADAMKRKNDGGSVGGKLGVGGIFKGRTRTALMAATAVVVIVGAWQLGGAFIGGGNTPNNVAARSDTPEASQPLTARMIDEEDVAEDALPPARMIDRPETEPADATEAAITTDAMPADEEPFADGEDAFDTRIAMEPAVPQTADDASSMDFVTAPADAGPVALREAADEGDPKAMYEIGNRYAEGRGIEADPKEAAKWYERAADLEFAPAQYRLGNLYEKGTGVDRDIAQAMDWYDKAAKQGNASAMHNLAVLYAMGGEIGDPDNDRAARWFLEAAELGVTDSQYNLGILAAKGAGVPQSLEESYKWFALVAKTGDRDAAAKRDEVAKALRPEQLEKAKQAAELWKARPVMPEANVAEIPEEWAEGEAQTASVDVEQAVRNIQAILNNNGYDAGPADGVMGAKTKAAIKAFQTDNEMQADGEVDDELVKALLKRN